MKRILAIIILLIITLEETDAQGYTTGIGIRGGYTYGLTVKHFISDDRALEGVLGVGFKSVRIIGMYELHANAFEVPGLYWYYGLGVHVAFYTFPGNSKWEWENYGWRAYQGTIVHNAFGFGIDGILGIEYELGDIPFTVGIDIKPAIEYNTLGYFPFMFWDGALLIRYIF